MKKLAAVAVAACIGAAALSPADARGGCGPGFHPGPHGARCFPNRIGERYDAGYWDGHRYWHDRYRDHGGWRYR